MRYDGSVKCQSINVFVALYIEHPNDDCLPYKMHILSIICLR